MIEPHLLVKGAYCLDFEIVVVGVEIIGGIEQFETLFFNHIVSPRAWAAAAIPFLAYSLMVSNKFSKAKGVEFNKLIGMSSLEAIVFALTVVIVIVLKYV